MTTAQLLTSLKTTKQNIKQALIAKGLSPTQVFSTYPDLINQIEGQLPYGVLVEGSDGQLLFQQLQFQGINATPKGQPVAIQGCYIYQTGVQEPQYEGISMITITQTANSQIPFNHGTVIAYTVKADDVITIDTTKLKSNQCATMQLWLTMPQVVSFTLSGVSWVKEPQFDTANTVYTIVLRWNGSQVIANIAYKREQV